MKKKDSGNLAPALVILLTIGLVAVLGVYSQTHYPQKQLSIAPDNFGQLVVQNAQENVPNLKRMTIHKKAPRAFAHEYWSFASTDPSRIGRKSDLEDVRAMENDEVVVLVESSSEPKRDELTVDVTYPLHNVKGKVIGVAGITLYYELGDMSEEEAFSLAKAQAMAIGAQLDEVFRYTSDMAHQ